MLPNIPVRLATKIGLGYAAMIVALSLVILVMIGAFITTRHETRTLLDDCIVSLDASKDLLVDIERMEIDAFRMQEGAPVRDQARRDFIHAQTAFASAYLRAGHALGDDEERRIYADLGRTFSMLEAATEIAARDPGNGGKALLQATQGLRSPVYRLYDFNLAKSRQAGARVYDTITATRIVAIVLTLAGILSAVRLWRLTTHEIVAPLTALMNATRMVQAGTWTPLEHPVAGRTIEIAALQTEFNRMTARIQEADQALRDQNSLLETRVAERTAALWDANAQLELALESLRELDRMKSEFLAITSHELLTPITTIAGFAAVLAQDILDTLPPQQQRMLRAITSASERLTRMVRNILEYSQLNAGKLSATRVDFDLSPMLEAALAQQQPAANARSQRLELDLPPGALRVAADPNLVAHILAELLDNAIRFTPDGGRIGLRVHVAPEGIVTEIRDSGPGLPSDVFERLFAPFVQLDSSPTRRAGGLGLGLALAHRLLGLMGSSLEACSMPTGGACVRFMLPQADDRPERAESPPA